jgi:flagellar protein FliJ
MTMSTQRLEILTKLASTRTDRAAEDVARARAGHGEQEARLEELRRYLHEYRTRPMPTSPILIANRERFLARLQEAETQQVRAVDAAARGVRESTGKWLDQRADQQRYDVLQDAAVLEQQRVLETRAQNQLDEFALRRFTVAHDAVE